MNGKIILAKAIPLTNGGETLVSCEDFHWLAQRSWYRDAHGYVKCDLWGRRGGMIYLGSFATEIDAARAYNAAALEHFKEFAHLNIIEGR